MTIRGSMLLALLGLAAGCGANQELTRTVQQLNVQVREMKGSVENLHVQLEGLDNRVTLLTDRLERAEMAAGRAGAAAPQVPLIHLERDLERGVPPSADDAPYELDEPLSTSERAGASPSSWTGDSGTLGVWEPGGPKVGPGSAAASPPKKGSGPAKSAAADPDVPSDLATVRRTPTDREAPDDEPGTLVARPTVDGRDPMALYKEGYRAVTAGSQAEGRELLFSFLLKFPRHELADNALYWIGESYYAEESFSDALRYFQRILDEYPGANKVPDAMVKAAVTLQRVGEPDQGRFLLNQVIKVYPGTQSAEVARQKLAEWTEGSRP
jgi:tol-pal system protein YbgF